MTSSGYVDNQSEVGPVSNDFQAEERIMPSLKNLRLFIPLVKTLGRGETIQTLNIRGI
jgi:hypothetical protein